MLARSPAHPSPAPRVWPLVPHVHYTILWELPSAHASCFSGKEFCFPSQCSLLRFLAHWIFCRTYLGPWYLWHHISLSSKKQQILRCPDSERESLQRFRKLPARPLKNQGQPLYVASFTTKKEVHVLCTLCAWGQCSDSLIGWYARLLVLSVVLRTKMFAEADAGWDTRSSASSAIWLNRRHGTEGSIVKKDAMVYLERHRNVWLYLQM